MNHTKVGGDLEIMLTNKKHLGNRPFWGSDSQKINYLLGWPTRGKGRYKLPRQHAFKLLKYYNWRQNEWFKLNAPSRKPMECWCWVSKKWRHRCLMIPSFARSDQQKYTLSKISRCSVVGKRTEHLEYSRWWWISWQNVNNHVKSKKKVSMPGICHDFVRVLKKWCREITRFRLLNLQGYTHTHPQPII